MEKTIEIKAMSKDAAIERALKILEASTENLVKVVEKEKSKSFLGLFNKEGVYAITIDKDQKEIKKEPIKEVKIEKNVTSEKTEKQDLKKETAIKEESVKPKKQEYQDKSDIILEKTRTLLCNMGLDLTPEISVKDGRYYVVNLQGEDNGIIIGKKGKTLNSFEYLLNSMIKECKIEVDVEGFKDKRNDTLRELGRKMAEKAIATGKTIRLNAMPPRERKIIHEIINQYDNLDTFSEGKDPKRYIVIKRKK